MKTVVFILLSLYGSLLMANEQPLGTSEISYAFDDKWNFRVELTQDYLSTSDKEKPKHEILSEKMFGSGLLFDLNYGPIGLYFEFSGYKNDRKGNGDYDLKNYVSAAGGGVFLEFKPFTDSKSLEKRALAFGLALGGLEGESELTLSDEYQEHEYLSEMQGLQANLFFRFYTVVDLYFVGRIGAKGIRTEHKEFTSKEIVFYKHANIGVGYAF